MRCLHCLHDEAAHETAEYRGDKPRACSGDKRYREKCACPGYAPEAVPVVVGPSKFLHDDSVETHPSYAVAILSRPSSTGTLLAGSDIEHRTFMEIRVQRATVHRAHHADRWFPSGPDVVSFRMSASQWAAFISSQGEGSGVPCTLDRVNGRRQPEILDPPDRMARLRAEVADKMAEPAARLNALRDLVNASKMTKADKDAIRTALIHLANALAPNLTFVAGAVTEHLEATRDRVVTEAEAHVAKLIDVVGRGVLAGEGDALRAALQKATNGLPALAPPAIESEARVVDGVLHGPCPRCSGEGCSPQAIAANGPCVSVRR